MKTNARPGSVKSNFAPLRIRDPRKEGLALRRWPFHQTRSGPNDPSQIDPAFWKRTAIPDFISARRLRVRTGDSAPDRKSGSMHEPLFKGHARLTMTQPREATKTARNSRSPASLPSCRKDLNFCTANCHLVRPYAHRKFDFLRSLHTDARCRCASSAAY